MFITFEQETFVSERVVANRTLAVQMKVGLLIIVVLSSLKMGDMENSLGTLKSVPIARTGENSLLEARTENQTELSFKGSFKPTPLPEGTSLHYRVPEPIKELVSDEQRQAFNQTLDTMKENIKAGRPHTEGLVQPSQDPNPQPETGQLPNNPQDKVDRTTEQQQLANSELKSVETVIKEYKNGIYGKFRGTVESEPPSKAYVELQKEENRELREMLYGKNDGGQDSDSGLYDILRNGEVDAKVVLERMKAQGIDSSKALLEIQKLKDFLKSHPGKAELPKENEVSADKPTSTETKIGTVISKVEGARLELKTETPKTGSAPETGTVENGTSVKISGALPDALKSSEARIAVFKLSKGIERLEQEEVSEEELSSAIFSQSLQAGKELSLEASKEKTPAEKYMLLLEYKDKSGKWRPAAGLPFETTD